jgi:hypothetical protein
MYIAHMSTSCAGRRHSNAALDAISISGSKCPVRSVNRSHSVAQAGSQFKTLSLAAKKANPQQRESAVRLKNEMMQQQATPATATARAQSARRSRPVNYLAIARKAQIQDRPPPGGGGVSTATKAWMQSGPSGELSGVEPAMQAAPQVATPAPSPAEPEGTAAAGAPSVSKTKPKTIKVDSVGIPIEYSGRQRGRDGRLVKVGGLFGDIVGVDCWGAVSCRVITHCTLTVARITTHRLDLFCCVL